MAKDAGIHIGTSGWHYEHWKGPLYLEELSPPEMLDFYSGYFQTVEINSSFYHLHAVETFQHWSGEVPENFVFAVKANRYSTHMKKLKDAGPALDKFLVCARGLEPKLGPVLFQLPPRWKCNIERLRNFLPELPDDIRSTFEFRDESWFNSEVYRALEQAGAAFCIYDLAGRQSPGLVTADFVYLRLHGPGNAYQGKYERETLQDWADLFKVWAAQGEEIFCFFDNDQNGYAALNAIELKEMVEKVK
jgi:uncharacterized protein YecE (DUF72 family)